MKRKFARFAQLGMAVCIMSVLAAPCIAAKSGQATTTRKTEGTTAAPEHPAFPTFPTVETVKKEIGASPKMLETLPVDFKFKQGEIDTGGTGSSDIAKLINLHYTKEVNGKVINVHYSASPTKRTYEEEHIALANAGISVKTTIFNQLSIDFLNFESMKSVNWFEGGIFYCIASNDNQLTEDELLTMAKAVIDVKPVQ